MQSNNITLTVIQLDLNKSSESTSVIEKEIGVEGTRLLMNRIKEFVKKAFDLVVNRSKYDLIQDLGGDGYQILFKDVDNAYQFIKNFAKFVDGHNIKSNVKKRIFRIAATTGEVDYDESESGLNRIVGHFVLATLSRFVTATPGWFYIDKTTFDILPDNVQQDFARTLVKGKEHEKDDFEAWRCQIFSDTSIPTIQPISPKEPIQTLIELLQLSELATSTLERRGLCEAIGIQPRRLNFLENSSENTFAILLINYLNNASKKQVICKLCQQLDSVFSEGENAKDLAFIKVYFNCS